MRAMVRRVLGTAALGAAAVAAFAAACSGPPAPDGEVCQDIIHRLCLPVRCTVATFTLGVGDDCEADLLARTGCAEPHFAFPELPGRTRVLECRLALIRAGWDSNQHPDCVDVADMLELCPDVTAFLEGVVP
jgi:hypothetical protein